MEETGEKTLREAGHEPYTSRSSAGPSVYDRFCWKGSSLF